MKYRFDPRYRRFIAGSTHVNQIIKLKWKKHIRLKKTKTKISTFATFSTTLSDNLQKNSKKIQLLYFELFSVGPTMNLRYASQYKSKHTKHVKLSKKVLKPLDTQK